MSPALARVEWPLSAATTATATAALAMNSVYSLNRQMQSTTAQQQQQQQQLQEDTAGASTSVAFMDEFLNVPLMLLANNRTFIDSRNSSGNDFAFTNFTFDESTSNKYNNESINSTQISNSTSLGFDENFELWDNVAGLSMDLNFYYTPFLTIVGGIGNILSIIVFSITKLRKLSSSFYLTALAVSDNCFLVGLFIQWLNFFNIDLYNRDYLCQFLTFLSSWTNFCSAWFVVAFTVERFIAVAFPLKRQSMCTVRHARIVILLLTLLGFMHSSPFLLWAKPIYFPKVDATVCDINSEYRHIMLYMNYYDTFVVFALPFLTISVLNTITGCRVWKFATVRRSLTMQKRKTNRLSRDVSSKFLSASLKRQKSTSSYSTAENITRDIEVRVIRRKSQNSKVSNSSQLKVTKMLLIVSSVFVCLNLPSCAMRIKTYLETQTATNEKTTVTCQYIFQLLFVTNYGINFIIYCLSGQNFRKELINLLRYCKRKRANQKEGATQITRVSESCRNSGGTGASTRRRVLAQKFCNELHELQPLKENTSCPQRLAVCLHVNQ